MYNLYGFDGYQNDREARLNLTPFTMSHIDDVIIKLWRHNCISYFGEFVSKNSSFVLIVSRFLSISNLFQTPFYKCWCHFRSYGQFRLVKNIKICRTGVSIDRKLSQEFDLAIEINFQWRHYYVRTGLKIFHDFFSWDFYLKNYKNISIFFRIGERILEFYCSRQRCVISNGLIS